MKKIVYVGFKFLHMGKYSGYDQIKFYADYDLFVDCQKHYNWLIKFRRSGCLLSKIYVSFFGTRLWWIELYCLFLALMNRNLVFHFIYAENIYRYLGIFKWLGFKIVCTYHQPITFFAKHPAFLKGLKNIDKIIVLSESLVREFKALKGNSNVYFIPHGVDTNFFCYDSNIMRERKVIMVGNWLREFRFAKSIFNRLFEIDSDVNIHVVALKENLSIFDPHPRLHLHHAISDHDLVMHYRSAALLFLPLDKFVANNAILEVAAVGCPILVASGQTETTMPQTIVEQIPLIEDVAVARILDMINVTDSQVNFRRSWINKHYDWSVIGRQTRKLLIS